MILTYEAIDAQGKSTSAQLEATNSKDAVEKLRQQGLFVTHIAEQSSAAKAATGGTPRRAAGLGPRGVSARAEARGSTGHVPVPHPPEVKPAARLPVKTLALVTRQMAMLLRAGSGLVPAWTAIRKQMNKPSQAALIDEVINDMEEGSTLADALQKHPQAFDCTYCAIVQAGEASATLPEMFERLAAMVGKRKAMRNKLLGALAYPALLIVMSVKIMAVLFLFVLPRFAGMFEQLGADVPASTQAMLALSEAGRQYWYLLLGVAIAGISGMVYLVRSPVGQQWVSNIQTRIPIIGRLMSRLIQGQIFRTMGLLLESRVGVLDSLELTRGITRNSQFRRLFVTIEEVVTAGGQLSTAFEESGFIEPYVCQAVKTGEDTGNLGGAITYCADMLDETNTELVNAATKLIEPLILIGMGVVVGTVAVSLFMPLFDMTSAVG